MDDARAHQKGWWVVGMIALAFLVVLLVMGVPETGNRPLIPALVPFVGWPFGLAFLVAQVIFCVRYGARSDLVLVLVVWVVMVPSIYLFSPLRSSPLAMDGVDRVVTASACASAVAIGLAAMRGRRA